MYYYFLQERHPFLNLSNNSFRFKESLFVYYFLKLKRKKNIFYLKKSILSSIIIVLFLFLLIQFLSLLSLAVKALDRNIPFILWKLDIYRNNFITFTQQHIWNLTYKDIVNIVYFAYDFINIQFPLIYITIYFLLFGLLLY